MGLTPTILFHSGAPPGNGLELQLLDSLRRPRTKQGRHCFLTAASLRGQSSQRQVSFCSAYTVQILFCILTELKSSSPPLIDYSSLPPHPPKYLHCVDLGVGVGVGPPNVPTVPQGGMSLLRGARFPTKCPKGLESGPLPPNTIQPKLANRRVMSNHGCSPKHWFFSQAAD